MSREIHLGPGDGNTVCGQQLAPHAVVDENLATCTQCLWIHMGHTLALCNRIAARLNVLTSPPFNAGTIHRGKQ